MRNSLEDLIKILKNKFGEQNVLINEPLSKHCSFKIGGSASIYLQAREYEDLIFGFNEARNRKIPIFVLGGGTNLVISDKGFKGLVIKNMINKIKIVKYEGVVSSRDFKKGNVYIEVSSGVGMNQLVRFTMGENLSGLEAFLGQPGTVGGAMFINAHNMGMKEFFGDKIEKANILTKEGVVKEVPRSYFKFAYDISIIQKTKDIILSVVIKLAKGNRKIIWEKAEKAMEYRKKTQPVGVGSSGCTFRNISKSDALRIGTPNGITSAGFLIEAVGLKGYKIGGAMFSDKHANFIVNTGGARAEDVLKLIKIAKDKVYKRYKVELNEEVVLWKN